MHQALAETLTALAKVREEEEEEEEGMEGGSSVAFAFDRGITRALKVRLLRGPETAAIVKTLTPSLPPSLPPSLCRETPPGASSASPPPPRPSLATTSCCWSCSRLCRLLPLMSYPR
jgi:hypothetical protein